MSGLVFQPFIIKEKFHEKLMYCKQCKNPSLFYSSKYGMNHSLICHRCKLVRIETQKKNNAAIATAPESTECATGDDKAPGRQTD